MRDKTRISFYSGIGVIFGVKKYAERLLKVSRGGRREGGREGKRERERERKKIIC